MKKIIAILLVTVLMMGACFSASADETTGNKYVINNVTVVFDAHSQLTDEQQKVVVNMLVNPEYGVSTAGLMCTLFGHKNTSETVVAITHKYNVESPRCMQEFFLITTCSRCNETTTERTGYNFITCCPEE